MTKTQQKLIQDQLKLTNAINDLDTQIQHREKDISTMKQDLQNQYYESEEYLFPQQ